MKTIYEFSDYKAYLAQVEDSKTVVRKGFRSRLAAEIDCQSAFVSQVLNSDANFGLEQGLKIARFLGLTASEEQHFFWMIEYVRAGSKDLKKHFADHLARSRDKHLHIDSRVSAKAASPETQSLYYSEWYFSAIHVLVTIPQLRTIEKMARALHLDEELVRRAVHFLSHEGFLEEKAGEFLPGQTQLHLSHDSPFVSRHHLNWRLAAMQSLGTPKKRDLHYSTVSSLSAADAETLRRRFLAQIEEYIKTVAPSAEEQLYCFNLDFFGLLQA